MSKIIKCSIIALMILFTSRTLADTPKTCTFEFTKFAWHIKSAEIQKEDARLVYNPKGNNDFTSEHYTGIIQSVCGDLIEANMQCDIKSIQILNKDKTRGWIFNAPCKYCESFVKTSVDWETMRKIIEQNSTPIPEKKQ